ncbi:MNN13 [Candida oxycetoniae]|uniref:MNN13 n=1 Tax=Candida oxycetoniae TaxID=497107 RepID=A0AAI9SYE2_9ASCO|nr:MNN13 [Candida oxycetoniae]KAI3405436.2 MNN13 [Candida oxycetoniae]
MGKLLRYTSKRSVIIYYTFALIGLVGILSWYQHNSQLLSDDIDLHSTYDIYDEYYKLPSLVQDATASHSDEEPEVGQFKNTEIYSLLLDSYNLTKECDKHSSIYEEIFSNHGVSTVLGQLDFAKRCDLFFTNVFLKNHNWRFNTSQSYDITYDGPYEKFCQQNSKKLKTEFIKERARFNKFSDFTRKTYAENRQREIEQTVVDELTIFRLYNKCFVTDDDPIQQSKIKNFITQQKQMVDKIGSSNPSKKFEFTKYEDLFQKGKEKSNRNNFDHRIYPWLSLETPIFERWTGKVYNDIPNYREILNDPSQPGKRKSSFFSKPTNTNFFKQYKNDCNGRGIVLTVADKHVDYTVNLIHLLRALNNKLPIQIVYFYNFSQESKKAILRAARDDYSHLPDSFKNVDSYFPSDYLENNHKTRGLPKQEVWFVNAANVLNERDKQKFNGFANKLLATLFNSFNEFMLIDADTVMMKNPETFFEMKGYKETGTLFFKDRFVLQKRDLEEGKLFNRVSQSTVDKLMFDVEPMTNHTLQREFFRGLVHTMESGMVLLNREKHFSSILMITHLNFIKPIRKKSYGDKELFWLGFAFNGDENYHFNSYSAASVGELTLPSDWQKPDGTPHYSQELCSSHPAQISEEDGHSLLWINSGFGYCPQAKSIDFNKESKIGRRLTFLPQTMEAFKQYYFDPLRIRHAIIPPVDDKLNKRYNYNDEPTEGWLMDRDYCKRYLWCAYSSIGGKLEGGDKDNKLEGKIITFSDKERQLFDYYGDIWMGME